MNSRSPKVPVGMPISWVGDWPTVTSTASSITAAAVAGINTQQLQPPRAMSSPSTIPTRNPELAFTVQSNNNNTLLGPHMGVGLNGSSLNSGLGGGLHGSSLSRAPHLSEDHFSLGGPVLYQNELNAEPSRSPSLNVSKSVNGSAAVALSLGLHSDEDSDLSLPGSSPNRSRLQSGHSGGADAFNLSAGNIGESRFGLTLPPINTVTTKGSSSTDCGAGSTSHTIVLDFAVTPSNSYGRSTANSSALSMLTGVSSMTPVGKEEVSNHTTTTNGTSRDTNNGESDDTSEVDVEIAALEAQLEVARLEARIKELKSKKAITTPATTTTDTTTASVSAKTTDLETA